MAMCHLLQLLSISLLLSVKAENNPEPDTISMTINTQLNHQKDFIILQNVPSLLTPKYVLRVEYHCSKNSVAGVQIYASSELRQHVKVFERFWKCVTMQQGSKVKHILLLLPDIMGYREDYIIKNSINVKDVNIRAWLISEEMFDNNHNTVYSKSHAKVKYQVSVLPPYSRPYKEHDVCPQWYIKYRQIYVNMVIPVCPIQPEIVDLLTFPVSFSASNTGVSRQLNQFTDKVLLKEMKEKHSYPMFTFTTWIYLIDYCHSSLCSIIHHKSLYDNQYLTPLLLITKDGNLHLQVNQVNRVPYSYLPHMLLPRQQWFRLVYTQYGKKIPFPERSDPIFTIGLSQYYKQCEKYLHKMDYRIKVYQMMLETYNQKRSCSNDLIQFVNNEYSKENKSNQLQSYIWKEPIAAKHQTVYKILKHRVLNNNHDMSSIGQQLYETASSKLTFGINQLKNMVAVLKQASCYGYHKASYMLSVLYNNGVGQKIDKNKSGLYLLISSHGEYRVSLMAAGNKHFYGLDGCNQDNDYSFLYYKNIADKTMQDRERHDPTGTFTEHVRLTDSKVLETQRGETGDYFLWLKHQAKKGVSDAQINIARMLFWGQQGVDRNMEAAVHFYQISAEAEDATAVSLYDYGVILIRGQGIEKNIHKGLENLNKSAELGHAPAITALGWYAANFENNVVKAVEYWEKADKLQNRDAAFNLGHLYNSGKYPGQQVNQKRAFDYFYKAARLGHIDSGVTLSQYYNQGVENYVDRSTLYAALWAKYIAEHHSPEIGSLLKQGVKAYLEQSWSEAYVYYLMAAESGLEVAQFNIAYLCEENH
ncbi:protein sel-1 homolog 3-like, partial [Saccoglossus kowalevskii]